LFHLFDSLLNLEIRPIQFAIPDLEKISDGEFFFNKLKENFPEFYSKGYFIQQKDPGILLYRIRAKDRDYHGILVGVNIEEYLTGNIKKHENTLITQEELMIALTSERDAIIKPVLITYAPDLEIKEILQQHIDPKLLLFHIWFEKAQQTHEFYLMPDELMQCKMMDLFRLKIQDAYIADGHHRMAAMSDILEARPQLIDQGLHFILSAWFDFEELSILSYNRIIDIGPKLNEREFLEVLQKYGKLKKSKGDHLPKNKFELIVIFQKEIYILNWHESLVQGMKKKNGIAFDVDLFNDFILKDGLHFHDIRRDPRIKYVEGVKGLKSVLKHTDINPQLAGFIFFPIHHDEFKDTADRAKILPPKSTWFEPRIRNGLIVQEFRSSKD